MLCVGSLFADIERKKEKLLYITESIIRYQNFSRYFFLLYVAFANAGGRSESLGGDYGKVTYEGSLQSLKLKASSILKFKLLSFPLKYETYDQPSYPAQRRRGRDV